MLTTPPTHQLKFLYLSSRSLFSSLRRSLECLFERQIPESHLVAKDHEDVLEGLPPALFPLVPGTAPGKQQDIADKSAGPLLLFFFASLISRSGHRRVSYTSISQILQCMGTYPAKACNSVKEQVIATFL